jgi:hypothetical protein
MAMRLAAPMEPLHEKEVLAYTEVSEMMLSKYSE